MKMRGRLAMEGVVTCDGRTIQSHALDFDWNDPLLPLYTTADGGGSTIVGTVSDIKRDEDGSIYATFTAEPDAVDWDRAVVTLDADQGEWLQTGDDPILLYARMRAAHVSYEPNAWPWPNYPQELREEK